MRPLCQLQTPSHVLRNRLLPRAAIPGFPRPSSERVSCLSTVNSGPDPHTSRTSETNGESHAPDTQGTAKEAEEMQVPLSAFVLVAVVVLGCGLPAAYFVGRALEKDTTSYRHLERKRKKRDAAWRELQKIDEHVFDVPRIAKVYVNGRYSNSLKLSFKRIAFVSSVSTNYRGLHSAAFFVYTLKSMPLRNIDCRTR